MLKFDILVIISYHPFSQKVGFAINEKSREQFKVPIFNNYILGSKLGFAHKWIIIRINLEYQILPYGNMALER